jgi:hypothetical protein
VNNFSIRFKLVSIVVGALLVWLPGSLAFAQPLHSEAPKLVASVSDSGGFEPSSAAFSDHEEQEHPLSPGPIIGLICAIVASSVALGVAFGIRRRIDRIAGPDPEKAEND